MRVILFSGLLSYQDFLEVIAGLDQVHVCGVFIHEKKSLPDWDPARTGLPTWTRRQLMDMSAHADRTPLHDRYEEVLSHLLADPRSYYLMERLFGTGGSRSVFNNTLRIEKLVWNALAILYRIRPDRIISTNTPHDITWFFARAAEMVGTEFYLTISSPLPWRTWIVKGLDEQVPLASVPCTENTCTLSKATTEFIEMGRSCYELAMPEYERERLRRYKGGFFSLGIEMRSLLSSKSPKVAVNRAYATLRKQALLRLYNRYSEKYVPPEKYIVFFLHYQPERTTLPDGHGYAQQWLAVRSLAAALPSDWRLVVKEHPSTFRNVFDPGFRDAPFYEAIDTLPNTCLAPLELTPFELIDRSQSVATVTGTVGVESLIRGKPVLVFGAAQYRSAKGVFPVKTIREIQQAIKRIEIGNTTPSDQELFDYFDWVERNSYVWSARINGSIDALRRTLQE